MALILKRASASRTSGQSRHHDDVLEDGVVVGRIFKSPGAPADRPWMWASGHDGDMRRAAFGYERRARPRWSKSRISQSREVRGV
jgi:hypothetical protein